jgi:hypothetical protein
MAKFVLANLGVAVRAAIHPSVDAAVDVAADDDRRVGDLHGLVVARVREFHVQADKIPHRAAEDALLLQRVNFRVYEHPPWHAGDALLLSGPGDRGDPRALDSIHGRLLLI